MNLILSSLNSCFAIADWYSCAVDVDALANLYHYVLHGTVSSTVPNNLLSILKDTSYKQKRSKDKHEWSNCRDAIWDWLLEHYTNDFSARVVLMQV